MLLIDIILLILIVFFGIKGYSKGLLYSILRFVGGLVALIIAMQFSGFVANTLFDAQESMLGLFIPALSFVITLILAYILINVGLKFILSPINKSGLSGLNKFLGSLVYASLLCIGFGSFLWLFQSTGLLSDKALSGSYVSVYLLPLMTAVFDAIGVVLPVVKETFLDVNDYFYHLSQSL